MTPVLVLGLLLLGACLGFINVLARYAKAASILLIFLSCLVLLNYALLFIAGSKHMAFIKVLLEIIKYCSMVSKVITGYLLFYLFKSRTSEVLNNKLTIFNNTLTGLTINSGGAFIVATIGKVMGFKDMVTFFTASGYAIWFLYFIMTAETAGGLGIILHRYFKTGLYAAVGLIIVMIGAVYTHWHNKDPFSDSYAAVGQIISLIILASLYITESRFKKDKFENIKAT